MEQKDRNVFISWYDGFQNTNANILFTLLKDNGFSIEHSPDSPHAGKIDKRWDNWYKKGLIEAIHNSDIFIAVITESYPGSTWMMQEYQEAMSQYKQNGKPKLYYVNFESKAKKYILLNYYSSNSIRLPSNPSEAYKTILIDKRWE